MRTIELLAPARDLATARTAINYGADAVYMGAPAFGARVAATNTIDDIARAVEYADKFGARVYVTLNTVLAESELERAERQAREVIAVGVDALIIQDFAYLEMGLGNVEFHASTQMQNSSTEQVKFLEQIGFRRAILERGLTSEQIRAIRAATDVELEAFVHGAICVCQSGRCYMSRTMSVRSGNRGECSQPCRLTYDLVDGDGRTIAERQYLLSLMDLNLSARIGEMLNVGITSFKIEGRLKNEQYVKNVVAAYRLLLDREIARRKDFERGSMGSLRYDFVPDLAKTFSRRATEYYWTDKRRGVASFDTPKSIGEELGRVRKSGAGWFELNGTHTLSAGDGIFYAGAGVRVNSVSGEKITINSQTIIMVGTAVYRNLDYNFVRALENSNTKRKISIDATWRVSLERIELQMGNSVVELEGFWDEANDRERMIKIFADVAHSSGGTIYDVTDVTIEGEHVPFVPMSILNGLRRKCLETMTLNAKKRTELPTIKSAEYYLKILPPTANITNSLAERFYRRSGVTEILPQTETAENLHGSVVMLSPYCIRREMGICLRGNVSETDVCNTPLYIVRGTKRYRLEFDCAACQMSIIYE